MRRVEIAPLAKQSRVPDTTAQGRALAAQVDADPHAFLAQLTRTGDSTYAPVLEWSLADTRRVLLVPPGHWLLVRDTAPFKATLC